MPRAKTEIDLHQLKQLLKLKPTIEWVAGFFECSEKTIERYIRTEFDLTFAEFREQQFVHTRFDMIREALERSRKSDTILIFCLKNLCGWRDKQPGEEDKKIIHEGGLQLAKVDLEERVKQIKGK